MAYSQKEAAYKERLSRFSREMFKNFRELMTNEVHCD